jgi:DNA invertase Pin-like site-specific DNA recombinase
MGAHCDTEPHLVTDNELVRNILLALLSSLAKVEAQKISDRTKAGMARAKAQGHQNRAAEAWH